MVVRVSIRARGKRRVARMPVHVCVCVCAHACMHVCAPACLRVRVSVCLSVHMCLWRRLPLVHVYVVQCCACPLAQLPVCCSVCAVLCRFAVELEAATVPQEPSQWPAAWKLSCHTSGGGLFGASP